MSNRLARRISAGILLVAFGTVIQAGTSGGESGRIATVVADSAWGNTVPQ